MYIYLTTCLTYHNLLDISQVEGDVEPRVSDVAETAYEYLKCFRGQNKGFGILLAGWDAEVT